MDQIRAVIERNQRACFHPMEGMQVFTRAEAPADLAGKRSHTGTRR